MVFLLMKSLVLLATLTVVAQASADIHPKDSCAQGYSSCNPRGSTSKDVPGVGDQLSGLYGSIVSSVDTNFLRRTQSNLEEQPFGTRDTSKAICCASGMQCLLLENYAVPFCWDKFTTNFFLSDGSYGSTTTGNYTSVSNDQANLLSGDYTLAKGQTGNMYSSNESAKSDAATMVLPTPFTSTGVGSAIPASELGGAETYTTTISGTIIAATTISTSTLSPSISSGSTVVPASTLPASTLLGTSLPAVTSVVTKTRAASATKTGAAAYVVSEIFLHGVSSFKMYAYLILLNIVLHV